MQKSLIMLTKCKATSVLINSKQNSRNVFIVQIRTYQEILSYSWFKIFLLVYLYFSLTHVAIPDARLDKLYSIIEKFNFISTFNPAVSVKKRMNKKLDHSSGLSLLPGYQCCMLES
jgi:hypothetical protein